MTATRAEELTPGHRRHLRLSPLRLVALGLLTLQIAWIFAVPPFRGSDEFDHVYKAASVARGDWAPAPTAATRGTGAWLVVPTDLVRAAHAQCVSLPYTEEGDCVGEPHGDKTRIASGAGRYHPLYYAIVGTVALPFDGFAALYAMRAASLLLCWAFFLGALAVTRSWATSRWPFVALAVAATPVLIYSSTIVAPNGLEMVAALAFWSSLVAILRSTPAERLGGVLAVGAVSGAVLATTRSLGPLWCLLVGLTALLAAWPGRERMRQLLVDRRCWAFAAVVTVAAAQSTWWIMRMGSLNIGNPPDHPYSLAERLHALLPHVPLWMLQSIAAFPLRNEPTQPVVYLCYLMVFLGMVGAAIAVAGTTLRVVILSACAVAVLLPYAISTATFNEYAYVWQGRYGLPYALGLPVLAGLALDRHGTRPLAPQVRLTALALYVVAQVVGPVDVMRKSLVDPHAGAGSWVHPPWLIVGGLALVGAAALWWGATDRPTRADPT